VSGKLHQAEAGGAGRRKARARLHACLEDDGSEAPGRRRAASRARPSSTVGFRRRRAGLRTGAGPTVIERHSFQARIRRDGALEHQALPSLRREAVAVTVISSSLRRARPAARCTPSTSRGAPDRRRARSDSWRRRLSPPMCPLPNRVRAWRAGIVIALDGHARLRLHAVVLRVGLVKRPLADCSRCSRHHFRRVRSSAIQLVKQIGCVRRRAARGSVSCAGACLCRRRRRAGWWCRQGAGVGVA